MDKDWSFFLLAVASLGIMGLAIISSPSEAFKETPAFSHVYINGEPIQASSYNDRLYITTEGIITTTVTGKEVTMSAQMPEMNCPILQSIVGFDEEGNPVCGL